MNLRPQPNPVPAICNRRPERSVQRECDWGNALSLGGPFPLTPALSLRERGKVSQPSKCFGVLVGQARNASLPLPAGEGRGEGEGSGLTTAASRPSIRAFADFHPQPEDQP